MKKYILPIICGFVTGMVPLWGILMTSMYLFTAAVVALYRDCKKTDALMKGPVYDLAYKDDNYIGMRRVK